MPAENCNVVHGAGTAEAGVAAEYRDVACFFCSVEADGDVRDVAVFFGNAKLRGSALGDVAHGVPLMHDDIAAEMCNAILRTG